MRRAIELAEEAAAEGEIPVGAVIVKDGRIIAEGRNHCEREKNALAHAEIVAINAASEVLGSKWLYGCDLYVTMEPCPMCAGAIINARVERLFFGAYDLKAGSVDSVQQLFSLPYNHAPEVICGMMERECGELLSRFFENLRKEAK